MNFVSSFSSITPTNRRTCKWILNFYTNDASWCCPDHVTRRYRPSITLLSQIVVKTVIRAILACHCSQQLKKNARTARKAQHSHLGVHYSSWMQVLQTSQGCRLGVLVKHDFRLYSNGATNRRIFLVSCRLVVLYNLQFIRVLTSSN